ncbi:MAG: hypothetical protein WC716_04830 [Chitinophagaceae bacterium]|jgi:hypothetical protein
MKFRKFRLIFQVSVCLFLTACTSVKPGSVKGGSNLYETFYQGGSTQYFIKPLKFPVVLKNGNLEMDFTFRSSGKESDTAVMRFSILGNEVLKSLDSFTIQNGLTQVKFTIVEHMFSESKGNQYLNRFSATTNLPQVKALFAQAGWMITLYSKEKKSAFTSNRKTDKNIIRIQKKVVAVL